MEWHVPEMYSIIFRLQTQENTTTEQDRRDPLNMKS